MDFSKYIFKLKKGHVGDMAFEWDFDGSQRAEHNKFVEQCKADGTYGEEFEVEMQLAHCPYFDDPEINSSKEPRDSYSIQILDLSK